VKRQIIERLWRAAIVCALGWIGWELHQLRVEMQQPTDDQTTAEADPLSGSIDDLRENVAKLNEKVDAMMVAMMQLKR
jgi:hypothetical protein